MSVGHVARAVEAAGVSTVGIYVSAFEHVARDMKLPRSLITRHPFGRPLGPAGSRERHAAVLGAALDVVVEAASGPAVSHMPGGFRA